MTGTDSLRLAIIASCPLPTQQLPAGHDRVFGDVRLVTGADDGPGDEQAGAYDWLAVCGDLTPNKPARYVRRRIRCGRENTVLFVYEPSSFKVLSKAWLSQFGHIISCHEPHHVRHPGSRFSNPYPIWHYNSSLSHEQLVELPPPDKSRTLSTICSTKTMPYSLHRQRLLFVRALQARLPELEVFGAAGDRPIPSKHLGIDPYRYHLVIENSLCPHYWTEKLSDAFLGWSLPFYVGAENICYYFPEQSLIRLDICDLEGSVRLMRQAMANGEYERRLSAIAEARRRVLQEHSFFRYVADTVSAIARNQPTPRKHERGAHTLANRLTIHSNPYHGLPHLWHKAVNRLRRYLEYRARRRRSG